MTYPKQQNSKRKRKRWILSATIALLGAALLAGCGAQPGTSSAASSGSSTSTGTVVIGGKNFTESQIMADMLDLMIKKYTHLHVVMKTWLDSAVTWNALKTGNIDLYVEYTGTGLVNILHDPVNTNPNAVYNTVKKQFQSKYHVTWLKPLGFNDTYAMAMRQSEAKRLGITTISQLAAKSGNLILGSDTDFTVRADTLPAMNRVYGTHFKSVSTMAIGLKYQALVDKKVDVIDAFSTDGQIPAYHLTILQDNKHLFPPYYAAPIVRDSVLAAHPQLKTVLDKLANKIDDSQMQKMNEAVDLQHQRPMTVAKNWLTKHGLL